MRQASKEKIYIKIYCVVSLIFFNPIFLLNRIYINLVNIYNKQYSYFHCLCNLKKKKNSKIAWFTCGACSRALYDVTGILFVSDSLFFTL